MKRKTRLILLTLIGTMIILLIALGFSYAYMKGLIGDGAKSSLSVNNCAKILLTESGSSINLSNTYPMSDNAGLNTTPYTFGIRSTCSGNRGFKLYIVTIAGNTLSANNVKYALTLKGSKEILTSGNIGSLSSGSSDFNTAATNQLSSKVGTVDSIYYTYEDNIALGEVTYYDLYMWVDGATTISVANKSFTAAVAVLEGPYFEYDIAVKMGAINTYDADVSCSGSNAAQWNPLNRSVEVFDVLGVPVRCTVTEKDNTNLGNLKSIVEAANDVYEEYGLINLTNIAQNRYNMQTPFYTSSFSSSVISGTDEASAISWDSTNNYWITNPAVSGRYYYYLFTVADAGYYHMCYKKISGGSYDYIFRHKNTSNMYSAYNTTASSTTDVCINYGYVETTDTIRIAQNTSSTVASLAIYMKKADEPISAGYRYEGENPNNYVWFNNESWRIIGSIPTKIDSGNTTITTNLVKIVKNEDLGGLRIDLVNSSEWFASSIFTLLNLYYYGAQNANNTEYCKTSNYNKLICDYTYTGIDPSGYYGKMIKEVYWNTGETKCTFIPEIIYGQELSEQIMKDYVGLMNASDYCFSTTYNRSTRIPPNNYTKNYLNNSWLFGKYNTINTISKVSSSMNLLINSDGLVGNNSLSSGTGIIPTIYLDPTVYVVSGDGTQGNPYKLGI